MTSSSYGTSVHRPACGNGAREIEVRRSRTRNGERQLCSGTQRRTSESIAAVDRPSSASGWSLFPVIGTSSRFGISDVQQPNAASGVSKWQTGLAR